MKTIAPLFLLVLGLKCLTYAHVQTHNAHLEAQVKFALNQLQQLNNMAVALGLDTESILISCLKTLGITLKVGSANVDWDKRYRYRSGNGQLSAMGLKFKFSDCGGTIDTGNFAVNIAIQTMRNFLNAHPEIAIAVDDGDIVRKFDDFESGRDYDREDPYQFLMGKGFAESKLGGGGVGLGRGTGNITTDGTRASGTGFGAALGTARGGGTGPVVNVLTEFLKNVVSSGQYI